MSVPSSPLDRPHAVSCVATKRSLIKPLVRRFCSLGTGCQRALPQMALASFLPFSVSLKQASERDIAIERSLQDLLNSRDAESDSPELAFRTAEQVAQRLLALIVVAWRAHAGEEFAQQGIAGDEVPLDT